MRRGIGIHGLQQQQQAKASFQKVGQDLAAQQLEQLKDMLQTFKSNLTEFATKYKKDIKADPGFRREFQNMCANVGVDPLASNKGFWAELLGVGDFYYELGVQIVYCCMATRASNGGLVEIGQLKHQIEVYRGSKAQTISEDDILRSLKTLSPFGNGFELVMVGSRKMISSVPRELNTDTTSALNQAQSLGFMTVESLALNLNWESERCQQVLVPLIEIRTN